MATGHLRKRSQSSWQITIEDGRDNSGKRKRIYRSVRGTKKDAQKVMHELISELETGTYIEPTELTVAGYLEKWIQDYCEVNLAPSTQDSYKRIIRQHLIPALGTIILEKLQPLHIQSYYSKSLKEGRKDGKGGLSPRTVEYHHRVLREALQHAVKWQLVKRNVADAVTPPKKKAPEIKVLDTAQVHKLLQAIVGQPDEDIIVFALYTGLRQGEILGLKWEDVDFDNGEIHVRRALQRLPEKGFFFTDPKSKKSKRQVSIKNTALNILKNRKTVYAKQKLALGKEFEDWGLVFCNENGQPLDRSVISHRFKGIIRGANLPDIRFHDLRHTHATLLLLQGEHPKIVQERLGHETINITLDTYSHVLPGLQQNAAERFESLLQSNKGKQTGDNSK